jgi:transcriptional regulator with XRE-family HTH domain
MEIGFDLRAARTLQGLSQAELAQTSGISLRQVKALESGSSLNPHPDTVRRLRQALPLAFLAYRPVLDAVNEDQEFMHFLSTTLRQAAPSARYVGLRHEQIGATSFSYYAIEAYDEAGNPIAEESLDALSDAFDENSSEYLDFFGYTDDSCCLDLVAETTLMPHEFASSVHPSNPA